MDVQSGGHIREKKDIEIFPPKSILDSKNINLFFVMYVYVCLFNLRSITKPLSICKVYSHIIFSFWDWRLFEYLDPFTHIVIKTSSYKRKYRTQ